MFDRYDYHAHQYGTTVEVTERRAPTDESVRLLKEMEEKAREKVLASVRLESNEFKGVLHKMFDPLNGVDKWCVQFSFNGTRLKVYLDQQQGEHMSAFVPRLRDAVAQEISNQVLMRVIEPRKGLPF